MKTKMTKFKILAEFVKDISSETKDIQTYLFVKDYISKYQLNIDINSKALKNESPRISTVLKFSICFPPCSAKVLIRLDCL